jgi:thiosulfate/3-mercaptopyruvate sulfurtransferase
MTVPQLPPVVSVRWLEEHRGEVTVCDVRSYLDGRVGREAFLGGHIPGSRFIDLDTVLAAAPGPVVGRHPMPSPEVFSAGLAIEGISDDTPIVAYDDAGGMIAGRLVWMLRIIDRPAALLDGGLGSWIDGGGPVEPGPAGHVAVARRTVTPWPSNATVDADEVASHLASGGVVVDSRASERYRGEVEPIDTKAGHVPGAANLPFADNLVDGRFRPPDELARRLGAVGLTAEGIVYCGSGVSACHNILAAELAGIGRPRLYVGSWSGWSSDPAREVETGE